MHLYICTTLLLLFATFSQASCPSTVNMSSKEHFLEHAIDGDPCAQFNLGFLLYTQQDYPGSMLWYSKAAEQGHSRAAFEIAMLYRDQLLSDPGGERERWLTMAAEQGLALAQTELGIDHLYHSNDQDQRFQAMHWFEQAAQQGDIQSKYLLGELYWTKDSGVAFFSSDDKRAIHFSSNDSKALYWICQAAKENYADAQFSLSEAYSYGWGTRVNRIQRQLWLELAASNGSEEAKQWLDNSNMAWYTRLEQWVKRQMVDETARCPDAAAEFIE